MKLNLNKSEFNGYLKNLISECINERKANQIQNIDETRAYARSIVEGVVRRVITSLNESDDDDYFAGTGVNGKKIDDSTKSFSDDAIAMLNDPIINREALADEIDGLNDLADGSARSYLSKVASGDRPIDDDISKKIVARINRIGKGN